MLPTFCLRLAHPRLAQVRPCHPGSPCFCRPSPGRDGRLWALQHQGQLPAPPWGGVTTSAPCPPDCAMAAAAGPRFGDCDRESRPQEHHWGPAPTSFQGACVRSWARLGAARVPSSWPSWPDQAPKAGAPAAQTRVCLGAAGVGGPRARHSAALGAWLHPRRAGWCAPVASLPGLSCPRCWGCPGPRPHRPLSLLPTRAAAWHTEVHGRKSQAGRLGGLAPRPLPAPLSPAPAPFLTSTVFIQERGPVGSVSPGWGPRRKPVLREPGEGVELGLWPHPPPPRPAPSSTRRC